MTTKIPNRNLPQKLLAGALLSLILFLGAAQPASAQNSTLFDIPRVLEAVVEFGVIVFETIGYKIMKNTLKRFGESLAQSVFNDWAKGAPGEKPMFEMKSFDEIARDEGGRWNDYIIEGVATGIRTATADDLTRQLPKEKAKLDEKKGILDQEMKADEAAVKEQKDRVGAAEVSLKTLESQQLDSAAKVSEARAKQADIVIECGQENFKRQELTTRGDIDVAFIETSIDADWQVCQQKIAAAESELEKAETNYRKWEIDRDRAQGFLDAEKSTYSGMESLAGQTAGKLKSTEGEMAQLDADLTRVRAFESQEAVYKRTYAANQSGGYDAVTAAIIQTLCNPSPSYQLSIAFQLANMPIVDTPQCSWEQFTGNWDALGKSTGIEDFFAGRMQGWTMLNGMIQPGGSGVNVRMALAFNYFDTKTQKEIDTRLQWLMDSINGNKGVKDVAGHTLTPGPLVKSLTDEAIGQLANKDINPAFTGKIVADLATLADTFINSLVGASERLILKGIADRVRPQQQAASILAAPPGGYGSDSGVGSQIDLTIAEGAPDLSGVAAARLIALEFQSASYGKESINSPLNNVLAKLQQPDSCEIDPDYCVIGQGFATALEEKLTLREALAKGIFTGNEPFGFDMNGTDYTIDFRSGFPYSSLVILRKYRAIPVGWEIAALRIKDLKGKACGGRPCMLKDVAGTLSANFEDGFNDENSEFYRLVDPDWVLKIPQQRCKWSGFGQPAVSEETPMCTSDDNGDGTPACDPSMMSYAVKKWCSSYTSNAGFPPTTASDFQFFEPTVGQAQTCQDMMDSLKKTGSGSGYSEAEKFDFRVLDNYIYATPRTKVCLAPESCLSEDDKGKCASPIIPQIDDNYGYCVEERSKLSIRGSPCEKEYATCLGFSDADGKTLYLNENSIPDSAPSRARLVDNPPPKVCAKESADCRWLSSRQVATSTSPNVPLKFRLDNPLWSSSTADRVYLTPAAPSCPSEQAGCTALSGGEREAYRVAPQEFGCDTSDGYKKDQCNPYALSCGSATNNYVGCKAYTPVTYPDPKIAGQEPVGCDKRCVGITSWIEKRSGIEELFGEQSSAEFKHFTPSSARSCPKPDVGCEEFTDIQQEQNPGTGEAYFAFSKLMQCVKPEVSDPKRTFYSWFGSDERGSRLVKYQYDYEESGGTISPKCADYTSCRCGDDASDGSKVGDYEKRKGTCRQFIDINGKLSYRWTDLLIVADAADCKSYRRTRGTQPILSFSPSLSRSCPISSVGCHEYHAPVSANRQVLLSETFDGMDSNVRWLAGTSPENGTTTPTAISKDTETLNQQSLRVTGGDFTVWRLLPGSFNASASTTIEFAIKADADASVTAGFRANAADGAVSNATTDQPSVGSPNIAATISGGRWTTLTFYASPASSDTWQWLRISTGNVPFSIDRVLVKQANGIDAFIRRPDGMIGSITDAQCSNDDSATAARYGRVQYSCQLYADEAGQQAAFQGFGRICPMQLVGCKEFSDPAAQARLLDSRFTAEELDGWAYGSSNTTSELSSADGALSVAGSGTVQKRLALPIKKNTPYTLTFRYKDTGSPPVAPSDPNVDGSIDYTNEKVAVKLIPDGGTAIDFSTAQDYIERRKAFASWQQFTFIMPSVAITGDQVDAVVQIAPNAAGLSSYAIDDVIFADGSSTRKRYLVDEFSKACPENFKGCTAYGLPSLNADGSVKSWSSLSYLVKPDAVPPAAGVCKEEQIGCKTYTVNGDRTKERYFKDPGSRACEYRNAKNPKRQGTCSHNKTITCEKDPDCGGAPNVCDIQSTVGWYQKDSLEDMPDCPDPEATIGDNPNKNFWVKRCDQKNNTCRRIEDPECGEFRPDSAATCDDPDDDGRDDVKCNNSTKYTGKCLPIDEAGVTKRYCAIKGVFALRTNYGRGTNTGVACRPDYYYKTDVINAGECTSVDVAKGCLLFMDQSEGVRGIYDSKAFYKAYKENYIRGGGSVALTVSPNSISLKGGDTIAQYATTTDANIVLQVRLDRECKTRLQCKTYFIAGEGSNRRQICQERAPCDVDSQAAACNRQLRPPSGNTNWSKHNKALTGYFEAPVVYARKTPPEPPDLSFSMLTGFSRPSMDFKDLSPKPNATSTIDGGRDSYFDWVQPSTTTAALQTLEINEWTSTPGTPLYRRTELKVMKRDATCKLVPEQSTPSKLSYFNQGAPKDFPNQCSYKTGSVQHTGLSGYCLDTVEKRIDQKNSRSMCVQWYPTDATNQELSLAANLAAINGMPFTGKPYYCLHSQSYSDNVSQTANGSVTGTPTPPNFASAYLPACPIASNVTLNCKLKFLKDKFSLRTTPSRVWGEKIMKDDGSGGCTTAGCIIPPPTIGPPSIPPIIDIPNPVGGPIQPAGASRGSSRVKAQSTPSLLNLVDNPDKDKITLQVTSGATADGPHTLKDAQTRHPEYLFIWRPASKYAEAMDDAKAATSFGVSYMTPANTDDTRTDVRSENFFYQNEIESIEYAFDVPGYGSFANKNDTAAVNGVAFTNNAGVSPKDVSEVQTNYTIGCEQGNYHFAVKPDFNSSGQLTHWRWHICDRRLSALQAALSSETTVIAVKVEVHLKEREDPIIRMATAAGDKFCDQYVMLANDTIAVPGEAHALLGTASFRTLSVGPQSPLTDRNRIGTETATWVTSYPSKWGGAYTPNSTTKYYCFNSSPPGGPHDTNSCYDIAGVAGTDTGCGAVANGSDLGKRICYASRLYLRPVELWDWRGGAYQKIASLDSTGACSPSNGGTTSDCGALEAPWKNAVATAPFPQLSFDVNSATGMSSAAGTLYSSNPNDIQIDITARANVSPPLLRSLVVDWGDGTQPTPIFTLGGSSGTTLYKDSDASSVPFSFVNSYSGPATPGENRVICVKAINNLLASTKICKKLIYEKGLFERAEIATLPGGEANPKFDRKDTNP